MFSLSNNIAQILACPICKNNEGLQLIKGENHYFQCKNCKKSYPVHEIKYTDEDGMIYMIKTPYLLPEKAQQQDNGKEETIEDDATNIYLRTDMPVYSHSADVVHQMVIEWLEDKQGIIIDSGCGDHGFKFLTKHKDIIGYEYKPQHHSYYPVQFYANGEQMPLKDNSVDYYISNFVIQSVIHEQLYLNELYRTLKPGGQVFLSTPSPYWYKAYLLCPGTYNKYIGNVLRRPFNFIKNPWAHFKVEFAHGTRGHSFSEELRNYNLEKREDMFKQAGFKVVKMIQTGHYLSLNMRYKKMAQKKNNYDIPKGIHYTHILEK